MTDTWQCDHCFKLGPVNNPEWLMVARKSQAPTSWGPFQQNAIRDVVHLCGWECVMSYANLQLLEPGEIA